MKLKSNILYLDGFGGVLVGLLLLAFREWLSELYSLPIHTVTVIGMANLFYGVYSSTLAFLNKRPVEAIVLLASANFTWTIVCAFLLRIYWDQISLFGFVHIFGEGVYVFWLAFCEWKWRFSLQLN